MFLSLRRAYLAGNPSMLRRYSALLRYERLGSSRLLSCFTLPGGCDTVFFPGCNLPGTRPAVTERLFRALAARIPNLGLVLDCCNRPSYSLGRADFFRDEFARKIKRLTSSGVNNVITACPGCHDVFLRYGTGLRAVSVYEVVAEYGSGFPHIGLEFTVHDPCALRFNDEVSGAVRKLLSDAGVTVVEMKHSRRTTFCCGEGGAVARADPELSDVWREKVFSEAEGMRVLTSCGGCQHRLSRRMAAIHLLDLLYNPAARAGDGRASRPPMTYLNRFLFRIRTGRMMRDEPRKPAPQ